MSDVPGPSSAPPFSLTKAAENYCRLCQLIVTVCSDLFRFVLMRYIEPANLRRELDKNKGKLLNIIKNNEKRQLLYPAPAGSSVKVQDLDLTLLYIILRNVCNIPQLQCKWGMTPQNGDVSMVACIERIRIQRNLIWDHRSIGEIEDPDFQNIWQELKDNIVKIEEQLFGGDMFRRRVDELFICDLSKSEAQAYVEEFQCLQDTLDNMQSQTSRHFGKKKARLDLIEQEQKSLTMQMKGIGAKKKARLDDLEQHQNSTNEDFIDMLQETEGHILHVLQGRCTGIQETTTDNLRKTEENILNKLQERMGGFERQQSSMETAIARLEGLQQQQTAMVTHLTARMDGFEQQQTAMATYVIARMGGFEQQQTAIATAIMARMEGLQQQQTAMVTHLTDGLSKLEKRLEDTKPLIPTSTIEVPGMDDICHISVVSPDKVWVSDLRKLQQVDSTGHVLRTLDDEYEYMNSGGGHTVSVEGDLVFIAKVRNSVHSKSFGRLGRLYGIRKMTSDGSITTLLTLDLPNLSPMCIHSSHINGDLLIGLYSRTDGRVMRCDGKGRKIGDIELDEEGQRLYKHPLYITENKLNGDIVVSDLRKDALVVMDRSGRHRFDYKGHSTDKPFRPKGVCTDILGRILVSHKEGSRSPVYHISLLDQNGCFLTRLLKEQKEIFRSLCADDKNNIYVGFEDKIKVFS
uniref:Uncharacterized protein LOC111113349 isoform X2 n=1 Tax=Crassostrea virginica TaxID=6565 RepID=A0A8B8BWM2_CRAVI|nr:uncharacterized protein LOC111113349 isoform X2 [Crassostrea virginica]